jgi:hypothetical protein
LTLLEALGTVDLLKDCAALFNDKDFESAAAVSAIHIMYMYILARYQQEGSLHVDFRVHCVGSAGYLEYAVSWIRVARAMTGCSRLADEHTM